MNIYKGGRKVGRYTDIYIHIYRDRERERHGS